MVYKELKENGQDIPVTNSNRDEYVKLYCDYIVNKGCQSKFQAFHAGFHKVEKLLLLIQMCKCNV